MRNDRPIRFGVLQSCPQVIEVAQTYEVDPALIHAIIQAESNYNPAAVSHRGVTRYK